jgi:hypothetical protein
LLTQSSPRLANLYLILSDRSLLLSQGMIMRLNTAPRESHQCSSSALPSSGYAKAGDGQGIALTVLFNDVPHTLRALRAAAALAKQLKAKIRILVAQVVPYPLPIDRPRVDPSITLRRFRTLCEEEPIETRIEVYLCRDAALCIEEVLSANSIVVESCKRNWPFGSEKRLARRLRKAGHQVVFVP